jgi:hypothetical protein
MMDKLVDHGVPFILGGVSALLAGAITVSNGFSRLEARMDILQQRSVLMEQKLDAFILKSMDQRK